MFYNIVSAVCDIGTAAFKYDMRRLSEILTFPKAWYNRNLTRRLFLGEESFAQTGDEGIRSTTVVHFHIYGHEGLLLVFYVSCLSCSLSIVNNLSWKRIDFNNILKLNKYQYKKYIELPYFAIKIFFLLYFSL